MNESAYATEFREVVKALEPNAVVFRHVEQMTRDVPDVSITLCRKTFWIEFKKTWESDPEGYDWSQQDTHELMGNVWVVIFVVSKADILTTLGFQEPLGPFSRAISVGKGRKGRMEAYRELWREIRPSFGRE